MKGYDMKMLAVIPARGGSKGVPGKNIRDLEGKPLLSYTIRAALESGIFSRIIVSTDDNDIADVARAYGAEVPFVRPGNLSDDHASSDDVVRHCIEYCRKEGNNFDLVCKLQPTSPLRTGKHIKEAYDLLHHKNADFVVSVCECEHSPLWCGIIDDSLSMSEFMSNVNKGACRQELPQYYRLNGAIYMGRVDAFLKNGSFIGNGGYAYIMEQEDSIDIDSLLDFRIAEIILEERNEI